MTRSRNCPTCGEPIFFSYVTPVMDFYIEDEEIKRDSNNQIFSDGPELEFYCSFDREHDIMKPSLVDATLFEQSKWEDIVRGEFYEKIFPCL
jgi:hypothetical protein